MESKKFKHADLTHKSSFFFSLGLFITMLSVVLAFEWKQYDESLLDLTGATIDAFEETLEVPPTDLPPPPPPKIEQPQIVEIPDEEEIEEEIKVQFDVEVTEETKVEEIVIIAEEPKEEVDEVFLFVEDEAEFPGGKAAFLKYIGERIKYPSPARRMAVEGKVFVSFIVDKDGSLIEVKVEKGIGAGCDEEAVRVIQSAPRWKPARQRGKAVKQKMVVPIIFELS